MAGAVLRIFYEMKEGTWQGLGQALSPVNKEGTWESYETFWGRVLFEVSCFPGHKRAGHP